ncbi:Inactive leucine-rich repeat receptor-like protein kinase CORYNE [Acorus gramineus]|uniref:Inactive leucine-rich repeat receptor-like protein kinase CORYNE n=1 Tax=Acorus gramineus TaxID=55184 RepID=A0AAV9B271_ACOGR|nr:Inactive leucine-rich repeat receptor-like protein kinase CORYNE [Acorus gramineus]
MAKRNPTKTLAFLFFLLSSQTLAETPSPPSNAAPAQTHHHHHHPLRRILLGVLFGSVTGASLAALFALAVRTFLLVMNRTPILRGPVVFSPKINPKTLESAVVASDRLEPLGGKYFKAVLDTGEPVAVKRLGPPGPQTRPDKRRAHRHLEMLARARHRNLMSLLAYHHARDDGRFSLVYDYVPNGSLEEAMKRVRSGRLSLNWEARLRIAVGIVKGLQYLHFGCHPRVLHYGLKPANVLLDEEFEPMLADCGVARLVSGSGGAAVGGFAYVAPECLQSCRYTDKSDVFSFGVILGVLLTGRDPLDPTFATEGSGGSLARWLRHLQQTGEAREALDKGMLGEEVEEEEMMMAIRIAVICLSDLPADRPSSDELVAMLTQLHSF